MNNHTHADPYLWGYLLWLLKSEIYRKADSDPELRNLAMVFAYSAQYVLPCLECRTSYCKFMHDPQIQPDNYEQLIKFKFNLHHKVNAKLDRPCEKQLELSDYLNRVQLWTVFISEDQVWDLFTFIALGYPSINVPNFEDDEKKEGIEELTTECSRSERCSCLQQGFYLFFLSACLLMKEIPHLSSIARILLKTMNDVHLTHLSFLKWITDCRYEQQQPPKDESFVKISYFYVKKQMADLFVNKGGNGKK